MSSSNKRSEGITDTRGPMPARDFELCNRPPDELAHDLSVLAARALNSTQRGLLRTPTEARDRIYLACLHLLLHLAERYLALALPPGSAAAQSEALAEALARDTYRELFAQDITPKPAEEYFLTFFLSNYRICSEYLSLFPLPVTQNDSSGLPPLLQAFASWLEQTFRTEAYGELLATRLWEAWPRSHPVG